MAYDLELPDEEIKYSKCQKRIDAIVLIKDNRIPIRLMRFKEALNEAVVTDCLTDLLDKYHQRFWKRGMDGETVSSYNYDLGIRITLNPPRGGRHKKIKQHEGTDN